MREVAEIEPNGIKVISTFSGCGGSSLGYRMAGCTVLGASEFVPAAYEVYKLNASPVTKVWTDDIREMDGMQMLTDVGLGVGELDILDGSPPCAAFSTAGKRSEGWGKVKKYSDTSQRVDDLFYEYARILNQMQPKAFVAENVEGLVKGSAKGYFQRIHKALVDCGYQVSASVLDASWLGVPQARRRIIFIGIRNDLKKLPVFPNPLPYQYSMADALPHLAGQIEGGAFGPHIEPTWRDSTMPSRTIGASPNTGNGRFPAYAVSDLLIKQWAAAKPPVSIQRPSPTVTATGMSGVNHSELGFADSGLMVKIFGTRTMKTIGLDQPSLTVTTNGVSAASHSSFGLIHQLGGELVDPECGQNLLQISEKLQSQYPGRKLRRITIAELRRLCSYPDDFQLQGSYGQRWERLGRSVPPVMMKHIAQAVVKTLCAD
jgi:DNA (cytosine-5)-methyltransferase 1